MREPIILFQIYSNEELQKIKCVLVGPYSGKTSLLLSYKSKTYMGCDGEYVTSNFEGTVVIENEPYSLTIVDTPSQEDYDRSRPILYYGAADVFLICFSVVQPDSVSLVRSKVKLLNLKWKCWMWDN